MNSEEYKKGIGIYEDLVEEYFIKKIHHIIKEESKVNNVDYLIKRLRENVYDSYLNQFTYNAFNDICLNTKDDYGIYVLMYCKDNCKIYKNLETKLEIIVSNEKNDNFIKNNKVIIPLYKESTNLFFNNLRNDFFRILTNNSETESINKILIRRR